MDVKTLGLPLAPAADREIFEGEVRAMEVVGDRDARDLERRNQL